LLGAWTSLHEDVSFVQLFIGIFEPLCVYPLCYEFKKGLLFVSIVLCILDMNKLEMLQVQNVVDEECGSKKKHFGCNS
jgi:hypothetical protein